MGAMPGDPNECRQHARCCVELAEQARTPDMRQTFLHLSETWIRLAAELESAQAFLNAVNGLEFETPISRVTHRFPATLIPPSK
jgi:hypothetical protein